MPIEQLYLEQAKISRQQLLISNHLFGSYPVIPNLGTELLRHIIAAFPKSERADNVLNNSHRQLMWMENATQRKNWYVISDPHHEIFQEAIWC